MSLTSSPIQIRFSEEETELWRTWVINNVLGWFIGSILFDIVFWRPWLYEEPTIIDAVHQVLRPIILTSLVTIPVAVSQWFVMRRYLRQANLWFGVTLLSFNLSTLVWWFILFVENETFQNIILPFLIMGFIIGGAQWLLLRQWGKRSILWIVANVIGSILGYVSIEWFAESSFVNSLMNIFPFLVFLMFGVVFAAVTGLVLAWLLRKSQTITQTSVM